MKQKKCPQCKNLISVKAPTCLYCGRPNKFVTNDYIRSKWSKEYKDNNINIFESPISRIIIILIIIILVFLFI